MINFRDFFSLEIKKSSENLRDERDESEITRRTARQQCLPLQEFHIKRRL